MSNSVTLRDVATQAGVSMGTASQALNNRSNVAPETRKRVVDVAVALGYPLKEALSNGSTESLSVIGILTKHDLGLPVEISPFYSYVQAGVESECRHRNISLMYANVEVDITNHPIAWPSMLREQQIDGLILAGTFIEDTVDWFQRRVDIPIVLVDSYAPNLPFDSVLIDNLPGAVMAVEYLLDLGHKHIGLIGSSEESSPGIVDRREGYLQALQSHNVQVSYIEPSWLDRESGYTAAKRLLAREPQITAIFACNDFSAIGVLHAAREMGLKVPDDLSVVGFDNINLAKEITPPLTTIHVPKTWMGILSVRKLIERVQNPAQPKVTSILETKLIVRKSVRSLN